MENKAEKKEEIVQQERILAQIARITDIVPIKNTDNLLHVTVLGWKIVCNKSYNFKIGDLVIYFGLDSILDKENPDFEFLKGKHIRTKLIMNTLSQGLIMPLKCLEKYNIDIKNVKEGDNVTNQMKVSKFVYPEELDLYKDSDTTSRPFPSMVPKTDEHRLQDKKDLLQKLVNERIIITRKEDGTSTTYCYFNGVFTICGRNKSWIINDKNTSHYFLMEKKWNIKDKMVKYNKNMAIQGEIVGPKINGNRMKLNDFDFRVFNIYNIDEHRYMTHDEVINITKELELKTVPILFDGILEEKNLTLDYLLEYSSQQEYEKNIPAEGIVVKTNQRNISFKVISNKYLLKYNL